MHLGHAYSALLAWDMARAAGGTFLLRIEDIDHTRARPEWEALIYDDLTWLGLNWLTPVVRQSDQQVVYDLALDRLWRDGLLYACTCTRADIKNALSAPQEGAPLHGPDGLIYPGTCRPALAETQGPRPNGALRLNMRKAIAALASTPVQFTETGTTAPGLQIFDQLERTVGDIILARRDVGTSYHLSVVLDDAAHNITHVVRGTDLFEATQIHVVLQRLLGLPTPVYHHHKLIRDAAGKRLAKRDDARAIRLLRDEGHSPQDVRAMVGL